MKFIDCPLLKEYAQFVAIIRQYRNSGLPINKAVDAAATYCISNNILTDILLANKAEVTDMLLTEYDEAFHIASEKQISYDKGRVDLIKNLMDSMNMDLEKAMDALKVPDDERKKYRTLINND